MWSIEYFRMSELWRLYSHEKQLFWKITELLSGTCKSVTYFILEQYNFRNANFSNFRHNRKIEFE